MPRRSPRPGPASRSKRAPAPKPAVPALAADWQPRATSRAELLALIERLPEEPGVYLMRDRRGAVVYVGKAQRLRARVRQYFNGQDNRHFVPLLGDLLGDIETVVTASNKEALLLENTLIKAHRPRFNVKLRDDKQFLVLRLDPTKEWPRLELVRRITGDGAHYFGPYPSASAVRHSLRVVNRHFKLRTCSDYVLHHRRRPCLQYQIGRCPGPCVYPVDAAAYTEQVEDVARFLGGRSQELIDALRQRMEAAASDLDFERAARLRDQLQAIATSLEAQRVVGESELDQDAIGMFREGGQVEFVVLHIRRGKLLGSQSYSQRGMELPDPEVLHSFLAAYYADAPRIPDEILLPTALESDDAEPLTTWLSEQGGRRTTLKVSVRGDRRRLLRLAQRNAASNFTTRRDRREDAAQALSALQERFGLSRPPRVIECYDISHIQGSDPVASMVVFVDGVPAKPRYRSFKIRGQGGELAQGAFQNDDFSSMAEVLGRRLRRALAVTEPGSSGAPKEHGGPDEGDTADDPWALPDLLVIDGGKGQLGRVLTTLQDLGIATGAEGVDVIALAKERRLDLGHGKQALHRLRELRSPAAPATSAPAAPGDALKEYVVATAGLTDGVAAEEPHKPERVFVPGRKESIRLRSGSSELFLLTRIRDEAHRFAITHHRKRRGRRALTSALDGIPGIGPATKRALLTHFGSMAALRRADPKALQEVRGVGPRLAATIAAALGSPRTGEAGEPGDPEGTPERGDGGNAR